MIFYKYLIYKSLMYMTIRGPNHHVCDNLGINVLTLYQPWYSASINDALKVIFFITINRLIVISV